MIIRTILFTALTFFIVISCGDKKASEEKFLLDSSGRINNVSVIIDNDLWDGKAGEAIRAVLAKPIYGLPQDEPTFTISQIPPSVFSGFVTKSRIILKVEKSKKPEIKFLKDVYAKPQRVIVVSGNTKADIIKVITENNTKIVDVFRNEELAERQRQMSKSPHKYKVIQEKLGLTLKFASAYRIAKNTDNFFWIRRNITTGSVNLMIYELPITAIKRNDSVVNRIIKIRDSIGKVHIEGAVEGTYMVTENAYTPFHGETIIDNKPALETKGIWDLKNGFMSGPFINYVVEDKVNKRWVCIEGFAFAPSVEKRNYMLELESIAKSLKID